MPSQKHLPFKGLMKRRKTEDEIKTEKVLMDEMKEQFARKGWLKRDKVSQSYLPKNR